MGLFYATICPNCNETVADRATVCQHCGCRFHPKVEKRGFRWYHGVIIAILLLILGIVGNSPNNQMPTDANTVNSANNSITSSTDTPPPETAAFTPDEKPYIISFYNISMLFATYYGQFNNLMAAPNLNSTEWRNALIVTMAGIKAAYDQAQQMPQPSERLAKANDYFVEGLEKYNKSMTLLAEAIDNNDVHKLMEAKDLMGEASISFKHVGPEMNRIVHGSKGTINS